MGYYAIFHECALPKCSTTVIIHPLFLSSFACASSPAGVGDLYTDPQMHTVDQKEYGEANLGTKGMALFFSSHVCGPLCEAIGGL